MKIWYSIQLFIFLWTVCQSQRTALDDNNIGLFRQLREVLFKTFGKTTTPGGRYLTKASENRKLQPAIRLDTKFPCNLTGVRSPRVPTSVHKLRPGDIDVIAAMGDSLAAGYGAVAVDIPQLIVENRGISWIGGGQSSWKEYLTLPNIIKVFNPNVIGYALSDAYTTHKESQFNVAEGLAISSDIPFMAGILVQRIKRDPRVDLKTHWKMISLMIGANDFCSEICYQRNPWSILEKHRSDLLSAFRFLKENLPRTIILLILPPHLKVVVEFAGRPPLCQLTFKLECSCLSGLRWQNRRQEYYEIINQWHRLEEEIALMPEFQTEDFTIVAQPFATNLSFPVTASGLTDFTYLSADCFHLSQKGYARATNGLWNNIMEPVGKKSRSWDDLFKKFLCPTRERPYIATLKNS